MANEYLLKEYELCFEQLRFYDKRQESILKYMFSLASAVATAYFAVYKLPGGSPKVFLEFQMVISGVVFVITALLYLAALENRLYFVVAARQVNSIRDYFLSIEAKAGGFTENRMYTRADWPVVNFTSLHTYVILGAALISSFFVAAFVYATESWRGSCPLAAGAFAFCVALVAEIVSGTVYLQWQSTRNLKSTMKANQERIDKSKLG